MTSRAPAFQFYPQDYLVGTRRFSYDLKGRYVELLCIQWDEGGVSAAEFAQICAGLSDADCALLRGKFLEKKITKNSDEVVLKNPRLEEERRKMAAHRKKQQENGRLGGRPRITQKNPLVISGLTQTEPKKSSSSSSSSSSSLKELILQEKKERKEKKGAVDPDVMADAVGVLEELNRLAGRNFEAFEGRNGSRRPSVNLEFILARLMAGATRAECLAVVVAKVEDWAENPEFAKNLRPATLFNRTKFAQYKGQLVLAAGCRGRVEVAGRLKFCGAAAVQGAGEKARCAACAAEAVERLAVLGVGVGAKGGDG